MYRNGMQRKCTKRLSSTQLFIKQCPVKAHAYRSEPAQVFPVVQEKVILQ